MKKKIFASCFIALLIVALLATGGCAYSGTSIFSALIGAETEEEYDSGLAPHSAGAIYDYEGFTAEHEEAIIVIPGIMASALYSAKGDTEVWSMNGLISLAWGAVSVAANKNSTTADKQAYFDKAIKLLSCDENQVPYSAHRVANMTDDLAYDSFGATKSACDLLATEYADDYDILTWQYDWRQHLAGAAEELENFINMFGYKKVCFVTHSLGGAVVANYLARSEENREKVKLFVPFGAPFLGAFDSVNYLFTDADYEPLDLADISLAAIIQELIATGDAGVNVIDLGVAIINDWLEVDFQMTDLTRNLASVYQMLPFSYMNTADAYNPDSEYYCGSTSIISVNGKAIDADDFVGDYLANLSWAKKSDGTLKPVVYDLEHYRNELFFENDKGETVYVTELVPTEYVVGFGRRTTVGVDLDENGGILNRYYADYGDSTIPAYSASAGLPLDSENVHLVDCSHGYLMDCNNRDIEDTGLVVLLDICKNYL